MTELLVATSILIVVLTAVLSLLDSAFKQAPSDQERAHVMRDAQVGLHRMTRELRQAYEVVAPPTAQALEVRVNVLGTDRRVRYSCDVAHPSRADTFRCVRQELDGAGAVTSSAVVVDGTTSTAVFSYTPNAVSPRYVSAQVRLPAKGEREDGAQHSIVLSDGLSLRNVGV